MGMSTEARIRFLADRVMGWKVFHPSVSRLPGFPVLVQKGDDWVFYASESADGSRYWNPFTSHNDAAEVMAAVAEERRYDCCHKIWLICMNGRTIEPPLVDSMWAIATATPSQRMEAVLAAYGWKEE